MDIPVLHSFNRGVISPLALARVDLTRTALSAETQTNFMPRTLGSMMLRPGLQYTGARRSNLASKSIPFVYATDDTAEVEITNLMARVWVDDALVTRVSVATAVTNGTFGSDLTGWTDNDEGSAASAFVSGGYMGLTGTGTSAAIRDQQVTVAGGDQNLRHALRITVQRGPVTLRVGSTSGGDEYVTETTLRTGTHSLAFTPTGNFHIRLMTRLARQLLVDSVAVEAAGVMEIPAPWAAADLSLLRWDQSGDVLFVACEGYQPRRIERRAVDSWSVCVYDPETGPYRVLNVTPITLTPSAISSNITLTASAALFRSTHIGALFRITSTGQRVEATVSAQNTFTDDIRVTGTGESRRFTISISGRVNSTITLQRSIGETGNWEDVQAYIADTSTTLADGLANQIVFYRIGIKTGDYGTDTVVLFLDYPLGSITGDVRITAVASSVSASAEVLNALGDTDATLDWHEGSWSDFRGWPTSVAFFEGRLWWAGKGNFWGSVSDAFDDFDPDTEGDEAPINRSIGSGPVDVINWLLPLQRLMAGTGGSEISVKSSSLDEPITTTNFNLKDPSTQGSAKVGAVKVDDRGIFVHRSGTRVYELAVSEATLNFVSGDLTSLIPEIGEPGIVAVAVQRQPDTRIHCVRSDGTVAVLITDPAEEVRCWIPVETDGLIEDVMVLPGSVEDQVYYSVARTVDGSTVRYREKWAMESQCQGATLNRQADSFATFTNAPAAASVPAGTCSHLVGETVVVWADGKCLEDADGDIATFTVAADGGVAALTDSGASYAATTGVVGLAYLARFKSTKLAYASPLGTALIQKKRLPLIGFILSNTHHKGLRYGQDFTTMDDLPQVLDGADVAAGTIHESYDDPAFAFPGTWTTDPRICLEANAPRCCTVMAAIFTVETHPKA